MMTPEQEQQIIRAQQKLSDASDKFEAAFPDSELWFDLGYVTWLKLDGNATPEELLFLIDLHKEVHGK